MTTKPLQRINLQKVWMVLLILVTIRAMVGWQQERHEAQLLFKNWEKTSGEIIWRSHTKQKVVAITLDDGPDSKYTPRVLAMARKYNVPFTVFLVGKEVQLNPEIARQERDAGFAIGNHTWDHPSMTAERLNQDINEVKRAGAEIKLVTGQQPKMFRPPKGLWDGDTFLAAMDEGYKIVLWSLALEHHTCHTPQQMADRVLNKVRPGDIILAHDGQPCHPISREKSIEALPILIEGLKKQGYRLVTVPELLKLR